MQVKSQH